VVGKKGEKRNETKPNQTPTLFLHGGERGRQINAGVIHNPFMPPTNIQLTVGI
jgi:hypothetical protein